MNTGKCPKCAKPINDVDTEAITVGRPPYKQWKGISYLCPACRTVVGVAIDPVALMNDTVDSIVFRLRGQ